MREMSADETRAFLGETARTGKLATVRNDGRPHVVPIWYALDGDELVFTTGSESVKAHNMKRDPRVSLCVDDDRPPFAFVIIEALAELYDDPDALLYWATAIGGRYMGEDRAAEYGSRNGVPGELLVRLKPLKVLAVAGIAD